MFSTVSLPATESSDFYCPDLLLLNARRIQTLFQQQDLLIAFDASKLLFCFQESCSCTGERLSSFSPTLYVPSTRCTVCKHDSIGLVVASFRRNTAPIPKRCTVRVSSSPSSRLRAAVGLIRSNCRKIFCNASLASA